MPPPGSPCPLLDLQVRHLLANAARGRHGRTRTRFSVQVPVRLGRGRGRRRPLTSSSLSKTRAFLPPLPQSLRATPPHSAAGFSATVYEPTSLSIHWPTAALSPARTPPPPPLRPWHPSLAPDFHWRRQFAADRQPPKRSHCLVAGQWRFCRPHARPRVQARGQLWARGGQVLSATPCSRLPRGPHGWVVPSGACTFPMARYSPAMELRAPGGRRRGRRPWDGGRHPRRKRPGAGRVAERRLGG